MRCFLVCVCVFEGLRGGGVGGMGGVVSATFTFILFGVPDSSLVKADLRIFSCACESAQVTVLQVTPPLPEGSGQVPWLCRFCSP